MTTMLTKLVAIFGIAAAHASIMVWLYSGRVSRTADILMSDFVVFFLPAICAGFLHVIVLAMGGKRQFATNTKWKVALIAFAMTGVGAFVGMLIMLNRYGS